MQFYPAPFDEARVKGWIARNQQRYREEGFGLWSVVLKETGEVIGDCGVTMQPIHGQMLPEIGYHIRKTISARGMLRRQRCAAWSLSFAKQHFRRFIHI